jgi:anti-sigma regulatory factor (Ser/Thr protein kinase)
MGVSSEIGDPRQELMPTTTGAIAWQRKNLPAHAGSVEPIWCGRLTRLAQLSTAREDVRKALATHDLPRGTSLDDVDRLLLVFQELTSNALRHGGGGPVQAGVYASTVGWALDVIDSANDRLPTPAAHRDPAHGGMGLHLIARLSDDYGWSRSGSGKHVWARISPAANEPSRRF